MGSQIADPVGEAVVKGIEGEYHPVRRFRQRHPEAFVTIMWEGPKGELRKRTPRRWLCRESNSDAVVRALTTGYRDYR